MLFYIPSNRLVTAFSNVVSATRGYEEFSRGIRANQKRGNILGYSPVLLPTIERRRSVGQRSFKLHTLTKKENKIKANIITLTNLIR